MRTFFSLSFRMILILAISVALTAGTVVALAPQASEVFTASRSEATDIELTSLCQRSYIRSANGTLLATLHGEENREPVSLDQIPDAVEQAILAVEDQDFYSHNGINVRSTMRALLENVDEGGVSQGGSTITQQLVKLNLVGDKQDLDRKTREAFLATRLEKQMSKDEILERYLNTVYFGNGTYGVQAAAEYYFGVDVDDLDAGQAALLAAVIRNPRDYNPFQFPEVATERRNIALGQMLALGNITEPDRVFFATRPVPDQPTVVATPPDDYFLEEVKQRLLDDTRLGATYTERFNTVFCGGLDVVSTVDLEAQFMAVAARNDVIAPFENPNLPGTFPLRNASNGDPQFGTVAIASVDPSTGAVRAMVGGPGFDTYKFNLATQGQGRQPGSSFKTFVLLSLLDQGFSPEDTVNGSGPCTFNIPGVKEPYVAQNFGNSRGGTASITQQTLKSSNCAFVRLGQIAGLDNVMELARELGITTPLPDGIFSSPLGSLEAYPIDMAAAYSVIFNDGVRNPAYYIESVRSADGSLIFEHVPAPVQDQTLDDALRAQDILKKNIQGGTGTAARIRGWDAGGKTGTAQDSADAWFVGGTKELATAVWMGSPQGRVPIVVRGGSVTGGRYPAQIWGEYMGNYHADREPIRFTAPPAAHSRNFLRVDPKIDKAGGKPVVRAPSRSTTNTTRRPIVVSTTAPPASNPLDSGD